MESLCLFNEIIVETAKVPIEVTSSSVSVTLTDLQAPESKVTITGLPQNTIVIKADMFRSPDTIISAKRGARKRADYIILAVKSSQKYVLYVEIKSDNNSNEEIKQQLKGAACFVGYCKEIAKHFWEYSGCLSEYESRFVAFTHTTGSRKRSTSIKMNGEVNDTPENMKKISHSQEENFNRLI